MKIDLNAPRFDFRTLPTGKVWRTRDFCPTCHRGGARILPGTKPMTVCCGANACKDFAAFLTQQERVVYAFPIAMTNDNEGRTRHYSTANKRRNLIEQEFRAYGFFRHQPPLYKQRVVLTRLLGARQALWDWDSVLRGNAKEIVDALKACKFFFDDSPRWVGGVSGEQDASSRQLHAGVKILIERAE